MHKKNIYLFNVYNFQCLGNMKLNSSIFFFFLQIRGKIEFICLVSKPKKIYWTIQNVFHYRSQLILKLIGFRIIRKNKFYMHKNTTQKSQKYIFNIFRGFNDKRIKSCFLSTLKIFLHLNIKARKRRGRNNINKKRVATYFTFCCRDKVKQDLTKFSLHSHWVSSSGNIQGRAKSFKRLLGQQNFHEKILSFFLQK